ncbi:hypothetical protein FO519_009674, partial [Halicephalobus sp. NKZ332]
VVNLDSSPFQITTDSGVQKDNDITVPIAHEHADRSTQTISFVEDKASQTQKRVHQCSAITAYEDMSPETQRKRRKVVENCFQGLKMSNFQLIGEGEEEDEDDEQILESLKVRHGLNLTEKQYIGVQKRGKYLSVGRIRKIENEIISQYPAPKSIYLDVDGEEIECLIFDFKDALTCIITWARKKYDIPKSLNVTMTGDYEGESTKISFFLSDLENPEVPGRLAMLAYFRATDKDDYVRPAIESCLSSISNSLQNGINVDNDVYRINLRLVADVKFQLNVLGLQSASSSFPCPYCLANKKEIRDGKKDAPRRTKSVLTAYTTKLLELESEGVSEDQNFKKECFSTKSSRMHEILNYKILVPPPLHCLSGLVNHLIRFIQKDDLMSSEFWSFASKIGLYLQQPSKDITGGHARHLLKSMKTLKYQGPLWKPFYALSEVEALSGAKWLSESETQLFQVKVENLFRLLREIPEFPITPKLHILEVHAPEFVMETQSWGRFSEQPGEHLHGVFNRIGSRVPEHPESVCQKRTSFLMRKQILWNYISYSDATYIPTPGYENTAISEICDNENIHCFDESCINK